MQAVSHRSLGRLAVLSQLSAVEIMLLSDAGCQPQISQGGHYGCLITAISCRDYAVV
jgi:hypothetical protein